MLERRRGVEELEEKNEMKEKMNSKRKKEKVGNHWEVKRQERHSMAKLHVFRPYC